MRTPVIWIVSTVAAVGLIVAGTVVALAAASAPPSAVANPSPSASLTDDGDQRSASSGPSAAPSGEAAASDIEAAIAAALAATGPGTVIDAEADDNAAYAYEIYVQPDGGGVVEVKLDSAFNVVSSEVDDRRGSERGGSDDD